MKNWKFLTLENNQIVQLHLEAEEISAQNVQNKYNLQELKTKMPSRSLRQFE